MTARLTPSEKRQRHIAEMRLAIAEGLSLDEARSRLAAERHDEASASLRAKIDRCGTRDAGSLAPFSSPTRSPSAEQPRYWWMER